MNTQKIFSLFLLCVLSMQTSFLFGESDYDRMNHNCYKALNGLRIGSMFLASALLPSSTKNKTRFEDAPEDEQRTLQNISRKLNGPKNIKLKYIKHPIMAKKMPAFTCGKNIYISPKLFKDNEHQKRFALGHEVMHIKNNDIAKRKCIMLASPFIVHYGVKGANKVIEKGAEKLLEYNESEKVKKVAKTAVKAVDKVSNFCLLKLTLQQMLEFWFSRQQEDDADRGSASGLGLDATEAGIEFFKDYQKKIERIEKRTGLKHFDPGHPTLQKRIETLQEILKKQNVGKEKRKRTNIY